MIIIERKENYIMSCLHNEMIMESLFEKYLEEGHSEEVAEEKAMEEFENMGGPYG
jgi:hypothetical protein|tara:strand:- start:3205 stop:3369 length:165 start_codon:yes stop_codon:yes gene_type:complete